MNRFTALLPTAAVAALFLAPAARAEEPKAAHAHVGHMVYFKLKDATAENKQKLVDACKTYLEKREGVLFFAAGTLCDESKESDKEFDVALHLVFDSKESLDKYAVHEEHKKFVAENKDLWSKVRVFDSSIPAAKK